MQNTPDKKTLFVPNGISKENAQETEALFQRSRYAQQYYTKSLKGYWPELNNDYRKYTNDPAVYNLVKTIRKQDEVERKRVLYNSEKSAKTRYANLQGNNVVVPIVGAGSIAGATWQSFSTAAAGALGIPTAAFLAPAIAVLSIGVVGGVYYKVRSDRREQENFIKNSVNLTLLDLKEKDLTYNKEISEEERTKKLNEIKAERKGINRKIEKVELQSKFERKYPKNLLQSVILGATSGATLGGLVLPGIGVVAGVLVGTLGAIIGSEATHYLRKRNYVKTRLDLEKSIQKEERIAKQTDKVEDLLDQYLEHKAGKPSQNEQKQPGKWHERVVENRSKEGTLQLV